MRLMLTVVCLAGIGDSAVLALEGLHWRDECAATERWTPQPTWLGNPSATASVESDGQAACFKVDEPGRGMKWSLSTEAIALGESPYLAVRYRAENVDTTPADYFVYLDDRTPGTQLNALRPGDIVADGQWRVAAIDASALTQAEAVYGLAVQVQSNRQGRARLWIDWIAFCPQAPEGATVVQRGPVIPARPDGAFPLADLDWTWQQSWLGNPATEGRHGVARSDRSTVFRVADAGRGMKWSCSLPAPQELEGYRYVSLRYRAQNLSPYTDYALCGLGKRRDGRSDYQAMVASAELIADGRWHTLDVDLRPFAREMPSVTGLAAQVQATAADAVWEIAEVRLVNARQPARLSDAFDWTPGVRFDGFRPAAIEPLAQAPSKPWQEHFRLGDWFETSEVTVQGIPFTLASQGTRLLPTTIPGKAELRIPVGANTSEVYLLLLAAMTGPEEPTYGSGKFRAIADVDRFRLRLEYADGTADECLPLHAVTRRFEITAGPQLIAAAADASKRLEAVVVCDRARQAAFGVLGATVSTSGERRYPEAVENPPHLRLGEPGRSTPDGGLLDVALAPDGPPVVQRLVHRPTGWNYLAAPCALVELRVAGKAIPREDLEPQAKPEPAQDLQRRRYKVRSVPGLELTVETAVEGDSLVVAASVVNAGPEARSVELVAPALSYRLAEQPDDAFYLVPKRGAALDNRDGLFDERYCGLFPLQFLDTVSPRFRRGLVLQTEDRECLRKQYRLKKSGAQFELAVAYPERSLRPGETLAAARTRLTATDGDWHCGLRQYRRWLAGWHKPLSPRKPWFREVFNFRQRFLWGLDPLYDVREGKLRLQEAVDEARREFGGIDYLHLFDWGNCGPYGRIYGRVGDHSPYDYLKGGRDALRQAIAQVQAQGVPVGLYIEAYLLEERGRLGQAHGKEWQIVGPDGKGRYWPECTEMYACSFAPGWRDVQAATYAEKVKELDVDGMYLDEYGFAGPSVDCWAPGHGHPVPSYCVAGERDATRMIRRRIEEARPGVALYSEESPVDATTQFQDGSFTYAMATASRTQTLVPLNLTRFAIPDFKTIEILYCDKPTGSWATGVKWVFFNGEAIWLEGPAAEWFEPETRETIRRCHAILRRHRDAFTSLDPIPLVPTELGGVFANAFPTRGKTVYTLYNARRSTVRGEILRLAHREGATYHDAWNDRPLSVRRDGAFDLIPLELGPCDVGCVVVEGANTD